MSIAFCFLTYENLSQPTLWNKFFSNKQDKCNIYIHNKFSFVDDVYYFHKYCIKNLIETRYAHISLVKASIELLKTAFLNNENQYFVFLSDTCIPLYDFDFIYNSIKLKNSNIIDVCYNNNPERFYDLNDRNYFDQNNFAKQSQFIILNRQTVEYFINNNFTYLFSDNFYAPDEHYFINLCNKFNIPYVKSVIDYSKWEWNHQGKPKTYYTLTNEEVNQIRNEGCIFMRKISKECNVDNIL